MKKKTLKRGISILLAMLLTASSTLVVSANDDEFARQFAEENGLSYPIEFTIPGTDPSSPQARGAIDSGSFYIRNKRTGKYLTAESSGNVVVSNYTGADNQKWDMTNLDNMWFALHPRSFPSGYYLGVDGVYNENAAQDTYRQDETNIEIQQNGTNLYHSSKWAASASYDETGADNLYMILAKRSYCFEWYGNAQYEEFGMETWKYLTCDNDNTNNVIQHSSYGWANGSSHWYFERISSRYNGTIDNIGTDYIGGWAYDTYNNSQPLTIRFEVKNNATGAVYKINNVPADLYRSDLAASGIGNRAYHYLVDWNYFPNGTYTVKMFVGDELVGNAYTVTFTGHNSENAYYGSLQWAYPLRSGKVTDRNLTAPYAYSDHYIANKFHSGIDVGGVYANWQPVYSPISGTVIKSDSLYSGSAGQRVIIEADNQYVYDPVTKQADPNRKLRIAFFHLQSSNVPVEAGDHISANTVIGYVGNTGGVATHLHISVIIGADENDTQEERGCVAKEGFVANPRMFFQNVYFYSIPDGFARDAVKGNLDSQYMP